MKKNNGISTSDIPEFTAGSRLTSEMFNKIITLMEYTAAKHGVSMQQQKRYSAGDLLTASDMNGFVDNINKIYKHIGQPIPNWSFDRFKIGGRFRSSDLNEIVNAIKILESKIVTNHSVD